MKRTRIFLFLSLAATLFLHAAPVSAKPPRVAVSIRPLLFIAQELMQDKGDPTLILSNRQSPHHDPIRPSQMRTLHRADIVFWIGPPLEASLQKIIHQLPKHIDVVALIDSPGIHLLTFPEAAHHHHKPDVAFKHPVNQDPHIWLDIRNAIQIARVMSEKLIAHDAENRAHYQRNLNSLEKKLRELEKKIQEELVPLRAVPILALHDAWRYFARRFALQAYEGIAADGLEHLGAQSFLRLKREIGNNRYQCVIAGPETNRKKARQLISGSKAQLILLDPLGNDLPENTDFAQFMLHITARLKTCGGT